MPHRADAFQPSVLDEALAEALGRHWTRAMWFADPGVVDRPALTRLLAQVDPPDRAGAQLLSDAFEAMAVAMAAHGREPAAIAHLEDVLARATAAAHPLARRLAASALAAALFRLPAQHARALELVDDSADGGTGVGDPAHARIWIDTQATIVLAVHRRVDDGLRRALHAHRLALAQDDPVLLARCARSIAFLLLIVGDVDAALVTIERELAALARAGLPVAPHTLYNKGLALLVAGRHDELLALAREPAWADPQIDPGTRAALDRLLACALAAVGRPAQAVELLGLSASPEEASEYNVDVNAAWMVASVLLAAGQAEQAREMLERTLLDWERGSTGLSPMNATQALRVLSEAREASGDVAGALAALRSSQAQCRGWVAASVRAHLMLSLQACAGERFERTTRRLRALDDQLAAWQVTPHPDPRMEPSADAAVPAPVAGADPAGPTRPAARHFVAEVAHELRNPLNGLIGMTSLLALSELDERQRRYVELTQSSAQMMLRLCNGLLDLSRMDAGRFELHLSPTDLARGAQDAVQMMRPLVDTDSAIALELDLDPGLPRRLLVDGQRVQQILLNLVGNAIKFTIRGEVRVRLTWQPDSPGSACGRVVAEVRDTGIGFDRAQGLQLFKEFEQLDTPQRRQGVGLGLALSRRLAEQMGGSLTATSVFGQGSTFRLDLPARVAAADTPLPS